jgi:uncharacterized oligopeptide transporter (OPT) family protein
MVSFTGVQLLKLIQVLLISGIKFLFAPIVSLGYGFNYIQTVAVTTLGGILGILFFYFLSKWIIRQYRKYCPIVFSYFTGEKVEQAKKILNCDQPPKRKFTRKNKIIINIRRKYGLFGIIFFTPVLLSIPIGAFLAQKYYSRNARVLIYMSISVVIWSFFISSIIFIL